MKFELFSQGALVEDVPEHGLRLGDLVTIVELLPATGHHPAGYIVGVFSVTGQTLDVVSLPESQLKLLRPTAIPSMREFAKAV